MNPTENPNAIFPKGAKTPADYFTGNVWLNQLVPKDETGSYVVADVVFEPGCRTNWHTHPAGQILLVTGGKGYYQEKGKAAQVISKGDVIVIPSHIVHWHGAAHDNSFTHIAITNIVSGVTADWLNPVTEDEYNSCAPAV